MTLVFIRILFYISFSKLRVKELCYQLICLTISDKLFFCTGQYRIVFYCVLVQFQMRSFFLSLLFSKRQLLVASLIITWPNIMKMYLFFSLSESPYNCIFRYYFYFDICPLRWCLVCSNSWYLLDECIKEWRDSPNRIIMIWELWRTIHKLWVTQVYFWVSIVTVRYLTLILNFSINNKERKKEE